MNYVLHLLILLDIYLIVAVSLNVILGYCGLLTLAHAGYFAIGAYTYALVELKLGLGFVPAALIGVALCSLLSLALSIASWRFRGDFFVLFSLAVLVVIFTAIKNWSTPGQPVGSFANLTNGDFGIPSIPKPNIFGLHLEQIHWIALAFSLIAAAVIVLAHLLLHSPWGRVLKAMRDNELAARSLGKKVRTLKVQAVGLGCGLAGFAGVMFASYMSFVDPTISTLNQTVLLLSMVIIGGVGTSFIGPFVGAFILLAIPEALRFAALPDSMAAELRLMIFGLILVALMHLRPQGVAGRYRLD